MGHILTRVRGMIEELQKRLTNRSKVLFGENPEASDELDGIISELQDILDYIHENAMDRRKY